MDNAQGQWVGYGLGDVSATVTAMKQFFVKKFASTAAPLQASLTAGGVAAQTYDQTMVDFVTRMQTAYGDNSKVNPDLVINGILNNGWQIRCGYKAPPKITIFTWQGTGVDMWDTDSPQPYGAAQYVAQNCSNVQIQPIGNYPASITGPSMGTSVDMGVAEAARLCTGSSGPGPFYLPGHGKIGLFGYSQGAICSCHFWRDEVLNPNGACHASLNDILAHVTFGNPCRCPGQSANASAGWPEPGTLDGDVTGGISGPDCLTAAQTPAFQRDYVWLGSDNGASELYTNAPVGANPWTDEAAAGFVGTLIYNVVQTDGFVDVIKVAEAIGRPVGMVEEIYNGIVFAAAGGGADHYNYDWQPAIEYLTEVCVSWTSAYINSGGATY